MIRDLHAYLDTLRWEKGDPEPVVPLDLFFEGNDEEESIAPISGAMGVRRLPHSTGTSKR